MPTTFDFIEDAAPAATQFDFQPDPEVSGPRLSPSQELAQARLAHAPLAGQAVAELPDKPFITLPEWPEGQGSLEERITGKIYGSLKGAAESILSPKGAAITGAVVAAPEVVGPILAATAVKPTVQAGVETVKALGRGDIPEAAGRFTDTALNAAMVYGGARGVVPESVKLLPRATAEAARTIQEAYRVGPPDLAQVDVEAFPGPANMIRIPDVVEQTQRGGLFRQEGLQGAKTVTAPVPRGPRPVIPETPPEVERGLTVIQEIRSKGADTKEKIRALFPQLSRETAGKLRDQAFPKEKKPDNLSRQDIDLLFLDKLNEESNREIQQAFESKPTPLARIEESAGQEILPFEMAQRQAKEAGLLLGKTESEWNAYLESQINKFVEAPVQPLVRQVLSEGNAPYSSNAFGPGEKGVWFNRPDGTKGFYPLRETTKPAPLTPDEQAEIRADLAAEMGEEVSKPAPSPEPAPTAPEAKAPEPTPPAKVEAPTAKEPWQMTGEEFAKSDYYKSRRAKMRRIKESPASVQFTLVRQALEEGKPVPPEVLADYPDLAPKPEAKPAAETGKAMGAPKSIDELRSDYDTKRKSVDQLRGELLRQGKGEADYNVAQTYREKKAVLDRILRGRRASRDTKDAYRLALRYFVQAERTLEESLATQELQKIEPKPPETPPTGPGMVDLGAATPASIPEAPSNFRHWWDVNFGRPAARVVPTIKALWNGHQVREGMAYLKDWVENSAKLFARSTANDIRQPLRRISKKDFPLADNALSMVIEAKGKPEALDEMRLKLIDSTKADPWWRKQALDALDYAVYHWDELNKLAGNYKGITSTQVDIENGSNIPTLKRDGYVPHRQEIGEMDLLTSAGQGQSTFFEKPRVHDTFADSIASGIDPKTLSATDLLEHRLSSGMRLVNSRKWMDTLRAWKDPTTGAPIATNLQPLKRADGSTVMVPPTGYVSEMVGPHSVAILKGYEGTFNALTDPSFFTKNMAGRAFMQANATSKSINLLIDTFHLGRLAFWDSLIKGLGVMTFKAPFPSYRRGLTMMDFTEPQIREMAANGEIPQRWLNTMLEDKRRLDLAVKSGYNVGRISDALYQDLIHHLPVVGKFNKWLFDQFQRGAMAESWLLEFERARRASPKMSEEAIAREVTKDLNVRFGNIGRQGWFKSKTAQDAARVLFLAPQWNEGLIKSELGAVREAGKFAMDAATGKRLYAGTLLRSVGAMALMQFAANQIINQATRGKFTWENEEEGWGSKLSAWVPDIAGTGPGFFLHPLGLAAETTHLLTNLFERSGGDTSKVILDYARSRSSAAMRPILTLLTRTDFLGRHIQPGNLWGEVVKSAVPTPIAGKAVTAMGKQMVTGQPSEEYAGQFQKQAMQSMGIRTEGAPSSEQRINRLAQEWRREKGVPVNYAILGIGDYQPLVQAVRVGNTATAEKEINRLRERHTDEEIKKHFRQWQKAPFTGSHAREREFRSGLTPVQDIAYIKARDDRERIASEIRSLLR